ncbi:M6 family metalloprotease domain-containing protein [Streptomyces cavernae]|uniref:M6 family metalloprotease domain-containing protein n=1 Tax=Streptomyces cavernae TaxID=2259034 RepID=UPI000FEBE3AE|nr:M6 family metalloprotease domain-containing protein [Streptomyces cavernae]
MSRKPHPEVDVPGQSSFVERSASEGRPRWHGTTAAVTSLSALAATSLVAGPTVAAPFSAPCALKRTTAHHSEGLDSWNAAYPRPLRTLNAVLVFLSFPDSAPLTTPQQLAADHFPATSRFFERASYGRFTLRPHALGRWIRMPRASTAYAIRRDWNAEHRTAYIKDALAASDARVDFAKYDIVYFVADPDAPGVDSDATKVVNLEAPLRADGSALRRVVTVFERHPPDRLVLAHETGHVFDLPDLYHRPDDGQGDWDTHVGDWDLMGSQFGLAPDLFAWHKWKLGWLAPEQVVCARGAGSTRVTLEAVEADGISEPIGVAEAVGSSVPSGVGSYAGSYAPPRAADPPGGEAGWAKKLAVVPTGMDSALAFEARSPLGNDASACREGVLVYRVRNRAESGGGPVQVLDAHPYTEACWNASVYPPLADAPVDVGETFTIREDRVRIRVEDRPTSATWTVTITRG